MISDLLWDFGRLTGVRFRACFGGLARRLGLGNGVRSHVIAAADLVDGVHDDRPQHVHPIPNSAR